MIPYDGTGIPVPPDTLIKVELRNGIFKTDRARNFSWVWATGYHGVPAWDIVAYEVLT